MEEKKKSGHTRLYLVIAVVAILLALVYLSIDVETTTPFGSESYPYMVTYNVTFPASEEIKLGNNELFAIPEDDGVVLSVNGERKDLSYGTEYNMQEIGIRAKILGMDMYKTDAKISFEYRGKIEENANFYLRVSTSKQIPEFLLSMTLPSEIKAEPM
ncbi:MAG: hypothetical protein SVK08_10320 [Halobacteriota archaeon]|nr:hypothetical protein [Halobacteriota archaeon]